MTAQQFRALDALAEKTWNPLRGSQHPLIPVLGYPLPFSDLLEHLAHKWHTYIHADNTLKNIK